MPRILLGLALGLLFGAFSVAIMIPMNLPDKKRAMAGAFVNRFSIGVAIGAVDVGWGGWLGGLVAGLLLSLGDAIITKAWVPILTVGAIGGAAIGWAVGTWGA